MIGEGSTRHVSKKILEHMAANPLIWGLAGRHSNVFSKGVSEILKLGSSSKGMEISYVGKILYFCNKSFSEEVGVKITIKGMVLEVCMLKQLSGMTWNGLVWDKRFS